MLDSLTSLTCPLCACGTRAWCNEPCVLLECRQCGFVFQAIPPSDPVSLYERRRYDRQRVSHGGRQAFSRFHHDLKVARNRLKYIRPFSEPSGIWLDVGAGNGAMLLAAEEAGFEAVGVELNPKTAGELEVVLGRPVFSMADCLATTPPELTVLSFYDVLEHLIEPRGVLKRLTSWLKPGGVLVVEVPDVGSVEAAKRRGEWKHVKPDEHLGYFRDEVLDRLVSECGPFRRCDRVCERDSVVVSGKEFRVPSRDKLQVIWKREA